MLGPRKDEEAYRIKSNVEMNTNMEKLNMLSKKRLMSTMAIWKG